MLNNLPNTLTWSRIFLIPILVLIFYLPESLISLNERDLLATLVFLIAAATDWLDGFIARKFNLVSSFGAFLDPVADKLMVSTALVILVWLGRVEFVVAAVIEITLPYIPYQTENLLKLVQVFIAILVIGLGGSIYLIANLGPGPRDGLMTGLSKKTRIPMAYVRNFLEISVVVFGWSLGGTAGVGTLIFAILIGPVTVAYMYFIKTTFDK